MRAMLGLVLVGLAGCGPTAAEQRAERDEADVRRAAELKQKVEDLKLELAKLQREMGPPEDIERLVRQGKEPENELRKHVNFVTRNDRYKQLHGELVVAVARYNKILDQHPTWNVRPLSIDLD
jgi:hypothetical protein